MPANSVTFSPFAIALTKLVIMGPRGAMHRRVSDAARSLKETEVVAVEDLYRGEMMRNTPLGVISGKALSSARAVPDEVAIAIVRRWFWSRKSTRGFVLTGFPASTAQALVFDEWLDNRDEALTACVWLEQSQEAALAEAGDARVCPRDGTVYYPSHETLTVPGHCNVCRAELVSDAARARAEVLAWFEHDASEAHRVAAHYRQQGMLLEIDANRSIDNALASVFELVRPLVADR
jgi:adenylate kinase